MPRLVPSTLTGRLVATVVTLVAVATAVVAIVTTFGLRSYLDHQLDRQVADALVGSVGAWEHGQGGPGATQNGAGAPDGDDGLRAVAPLGQRVGTVAMVHDATHQSGFLVASNARRQLSTSAKAALAQVPADGKTHDVDVPGLGHYRAQATTLSGLGFVAGVPTRETDAIVAKLVGWEVLLGVLAVAVSAAVGRFLVRRQLRPLREVAATAHEVSGLPLSSGEIEMSVRVPDELTDPRTEVGQVGSAMNTMLGHVEQALDERHRSELQVRQFVADASHELRTPLATIHGYAELSRRTSPADVDQLSQAMAKVESEATRMSSLVDDLLLLARLDAGRPLERREVDLTRLALEVVSDAQVVAPDHRWRLDLPDEPVVTTGDEQRLHQVVTNLLNNARRHTPAGTTVTVSVSAADDGAATLRVQDDGPGIPPELAGRAFERFTRGDSSRTRASGGAGLGLSLVKAIVTAHLGTVQLDSEPGATAFSIHLPGAGLSQVVDRTVTQTTKI